jgi:hypothetical protein
MKIVFKEFVIKNAIATIILLTLCLNAVAQKDSNYKKFTYYKIGLDITKPLASVLSTQKKAVEFHAETNFSPEINLSVNAGYGSSSVKNQYLTYTNNNVFFAGGFDKLLFKPEYANDKSNIYIGIQYGISPIRRSIANFTSYDSLFGNRNGIIPSSNFLVHWAGIHIGFSLEVKKNIFLGWQIDGKTIISSKKLKELQPAYIAGYGHGDKNPTYNYHFYILYGFGKSKKIKNG